MVRGRSTAAPPSIFYDRGMQIGYVIRRKLEVPTLRCHAKRYLVAQASACAIFFAARSEDRIG